MSLGILAAFIHSELGEQGEALLIIQNIIENEKNISKKEYDFMHYFVKERLDYITRDGKNKSK